MNLTIIAALLQQSRAKGVPVYIYLNSESGFRLLTESGDFLVLR